MNGSEHRTSTDRSYPPAGRYWLFCVLVDVPHVDLPLKDRISRLYSDWLVPLLLSWCSVRRRIQFFAALLSIALQASDLLLGGWGHRHSHDAVVDHACHSECDGHEHGGQADEFDSEDGLPVEHHDDCSLCRHFSQPVAPISVDIPVVTCERVAPLLIHLVAVAGVDVEIAHAARGPPASVA